MAPGNVPADAVNLGQLVEIAEGSAIANVVIGCCSMIAVMRYATAGGMLCPKPLTIGLLEKVFRREKLADAGRPGRNKIKLDKQKVDCIIGNLYLTFLICKICKTHLSSFLAELF